MATKINTLKQLRKGNDGTFLGNKDNQLKWLTIAELGVKDAAAITEEINNAIEAAKNQLKVEINTAKFVGPVASEAGQEGNIDTNDLLLVGNAAPYKIFAKVGGALVEVGKTDVDLSNYHTKQEIAGITAGIAQAATQEITQAKQEAIAAAEQDATTKANQAKQEAVAEATLAAQQQAQEAARTAGEDATRKAEQAKQEAITAAAQDATTKAENVKNELDPRITALEQRTDEITRYALYGFNFTEGFDAANIDRNNTKVNVTTGKGEDFTPEELNGVVVYLNGVRQTKGIDYDNIQRTLPLNGSFTFDFLVELDGEDTVSVSGHYLKEA